MIKFHLSNSSRSSVRGCVNVTSSGERAVTAPGIRDAIRHAAQEQGFDEHFTFSLEQHTDWDAIFSVCRSLSLFAGRQTLTLYLPENGPNAAMGEQLLRLAGSYIRICC